MSAIRLAVFDCDGTLVDSQHSIVAAMERAFAMHGMAAPGRRDILSIVGLSVPEAIGVLLPDASDGLRDAVAGNYKRAFHALRAAGEVSEPLYDGIVDVIAALGDAGWLLGVATGKSDRGLALCLAAHGIADRFVTLQTADRHPSKPHPAMLAAAMAEAGASPATTVMIGDTGFDMAMAAAAGARAIGVGWGYHDAAELWAAGAHAVVATPGALADEVMR